MLWASGKYINNKNMAEETVKQTVGEGTEVQVIISMQPLVGADGTDYSLSELNWSCSFEGNKGKYNVLKGDATQQSSDSYECLVDTSITGKSADLKAVLTITNIPTAMGGRKEVTPPMSTGIEVV